MQPEFGIEGRERRFKEGQVIDLPATLDDASGVRWCVEWVEVSTLDDRAIGERAFIPGFLELDGKAR